MRFNRLDLNLLVALDALLSERSISRAAEKVHLSQSTMSHALGRLREHFKDELLVQVGRRMELTPRAEGLCDPIRDVLVRISSTIDAEPMFDPARSDRVFVMQVSDFTMELLLPHLLALASDQRSKVRFKLMPQTGNPALALERGEVDMLVIPEAYCSPEHPTEAVFEEDFQVVMWRESRLAQVELTTTRYAQARHIVMEPANTGRPAYESWLVQGHGITRDVVLSTYSFCALPSMIVGTEFIATVHSRLARRAAATLPIKVVPVPVPMPPLVQTMQWHQHRTRDPGLVWVRSLLRAAACRMNAAEPSPPLTATAPVGPADVTS